MPRSPRYIPRGSLVEITCRTLESRYFLRPSRELREAIHGVLARAATCWQVGVVTWIYVSNHCTSWCARRTLATSPASWARVDTQVSKEVNRAIGRRGKMWGRRYRPILVAPDQEEARLRREGKTVLGVKRVQRVDPWDRPEATKRSPAPPFHTKDPVRRRRWYEDRRELRDAYAAASAELLAGNLEAVFPLGSFRPALPFYSGRPPT